MSGGSELDQLERLNRLRQSGALTQQEFEQQKALILSAAQPRAFRRLWPIVALVILLVVAAVTAGFAVLGRSASKSASPSPVPVASAVSQNPEPPTETSKQPPRPTPALADASSGALLRFATSFEVIGLNPAYLDRRLGVPRESWNDHRVFDVGGCRITYWARSNSVEGFHLEVGPSCQPIIEGKRIGPQTSFGSILRSKPGGEYFASCLYMCGNAADPTVDLVYGASRATGFISVSYLAEYSEVADAMDLWEKSIRRQQGLGENDWPVDSSLFSCVRRPPETVSRVLGRARVNMIFVSLERDGGC